MIRIKQVKARYFRFVDEKKYEELAALFTPEAKAVTDGTTWDSGAEMADVVRDLGHGGPADVPRREGRPGGP